tara:strand:- start:1342 stop:2088 length:747 start_codon:yes stop_codon:yes gene_type:complete
MAYAVCARARILAKDHWRDNTLTGTILVDGSEYQFKTRGHVAKATNSRFTDVQWKPEEDDEIIFDGELFKNQAIIDHMEPWRPSEHTPLGRHDDLVNRLTERLPSLSEMTKHTRHRAHIDQGVEVRCIRWVKDATAKQGRKNIPVVVSAICADGEIRFASRTKAGAKLVDNSTVAILPLLAQTLGIPTPEFESAPVPKPAAKKTANPNKWVAGQPYRPEGMPEPEPEMDDPFSDAGSTTGEVYDDIPF